MGCARLRCRLRDENSENRKKKKQRLAGGMSDKRRVDEVHKQAVVVGELGAPLQSTSSLWTLDEV